MKCKHCKKEIMLLNVHYVHKSTKLVWCELGLVAEPEKEYLTQIEELGEMKREGKLTDHFMIQCKDCDSEEVLIYYDFQDLDLKFSCMSCGNQWDLTIAKQEKVGK